MVYSFYHWVLNFYDPDGEECPVAILWHSGHAPHLNNFVTIEEVGEIQCTSRLNISKQIFAREGSSCPQNFQWRGI